MFTQGVDGGWAGNGLTTPRRQGVGVFLGVIFVGVWLSGNLAMGGCGCWVGERRHGITIGRRALRGKGEMSVWWGAPQWSSTVEPVSEEHRGESHM